MIVTTFEINTTAGIRYELKEVKENRVLIGATARFKTKSGALRYALKQGYEIEK